jgi:glucarate dehydratase
MEGGNWSFSQGAMGVPEGVGLGIRVDEDAVARMTEAYHRCGQTKRSDVEYMRSRYDPTWEPLRPRW